MAARRKLTIKIAETAGTLNRVLAWANGHPIIHSDGEDGDWTGTVPAGKVTLETAVWGHGKAKYELTIDLPGTVDDQKLEFSLTNGYHDAEYKI